MPRHTLADLEELVASDPTLGDELLDLLPQWERSMIALGRSPATRKDYLAAGRDLHRYLKSVGMPTLLQHVGYEHVESYLADLATRGKKPNTVNARYRALRQLFKWAAGPSNRIIRADPIRDMPVPKSEIPPTEILTQKQLDKMLAACDKTTFEGTRDLLALRLLMEGGFRRAELVAITIDDIDQANKVIKIRRGKGGKSRLVGYSPKTASDLDRYVRARTIFLRSRGLPDTYQPFWVGGQTKSKGVGQSVGWLYWLVRNKATAAGLGTVHPHQLRHYFAHNYLADGGQEGELMSLGGWSSAQQIHTRYGASLRMERALEAQRKMFERNPDRFR